MLSPLKGVAVRLGNPTEVAYFIAAGEPGRAGTIGAQLVRPADGYVDVTPYYCTLGSAKGADAPPPPG